MTWHRIDDPEHPAPKDGTEVLLWGKIDSSVSPYFRQYIGHFFKSNNSENGGWWVVHAMPLTVIYWQPLPEPPRP